MTGAVARDSAQRRPSDKHRWDARDTYSIAERLSPSRPARHPILPVRRANPKLVADCDPNLANPRPDWSPELVSSAGAVREDETGCE